MQNTPAPSAQRLLGSLKNSFTTSANLTAKNNPPVVADTVFVPPQSIQLDDEEKLDIFESVLAEAEAQVRAAEPPIDVPQESLVSQVAVAPLEPVSAVSPEPVAQASLAQTQEPVVVPEQAANPQLVTLTPTVTADDAMLGQIAAGVDPYAITDLNPPNPTAVGPKEAGVAIISPEQPSSGAVEIEPQKELSPEVESFIEKVEDQQDQLPQEIVIADGNMTLSPVQYPAQPVIVLPITQDIEKMGENKAPKFSVRWLVEWSHKIVKIFAGKVIYKQVNQ